jgi:hypothetical protein
MIEAVDFEFWLGVFGFSIIEHNGAESIVVASGQRGDVALAEVKADSYVRSVDG